MTFLELCQTTSRKSGTVDGILPITIAGQTGRLNKIVENVRQAWRSIQLDQSNWLWMRKEWQGTLTPSTAKYTGASFGITDFGRWLTDAPYSAYRSMTIYDPTIGLTDESDLWEITYEQWRSIYGRGVQENQKPMHFAISPQGELCFGPIPDKAYVAGGEYYTALQALTADGTIPALPSDFHDIIWNRALMLLNEDDEAAFAVGTAREEYHRLNSELVISQLPAMKTPMRPPPLA